MKITQKSHYCIMKIIQNVYLSAIIYMHVYNTTVYSDCISIVEGKYIHTDNVMKWIIIVMRIVSLIKIKSRGTRTLH